jgi:hypothetical protein
MAAPTPTVMPARRDPHLATSAAPKPVRAGEVLFTDTATGLTGVIRQRPGDGVFLFHPTAPGAPVEVVEEPGRFRVLRTGHAGHDTRPGDHNDRESQRSTTGQRRRRAHHRGHRGGGRGRRQKR